MADQENELNSVVVQYDLLGIPTRFIVQYTKENGEKAQTTNNYDDLTNEEIDMLYERFKLYLNMLNDEY